jgi:hypothetical protein
VCWNLNWSSKIIYSRELTSHIQSERDNSRDWYTKLAKSLFKLNLASLYSPNLILRDLLENIILSCSAHLFLSVLSLTFWVCCHSSFFSVLSLTFFSVMSLLLPIGLTAYFYKGPSSTSVKTLFKYIDSTSIVRGWGSRKCRHC